MKNKDIAIMLALLPTGWIGLHKYYLGKKYAPIIYTLFVWTTIPIIISLVDAIRLQRMSDNYFIKKYSTENEYREYIKNQSQKVLSEEQNININNNFSENNEYNEPDFSDYYGPWMNDNTDNSNTDNSNTDNSNTDNSNTDNSNTDNSNTDNSNTPKYNKYG